MKEREAVKEKHVKSDPGFYFGPPIEKTNSGPAIVYENIYGHKKNTQPLRFHCCWSSSID